MIWIPIIITVVGFFLVLMEGIDIGIFYIVSSLAWIVYAAVERVV